MTTREFSSLRIPHLRYWRELAVFSLMVMELSWIVPWYRSLTPQTYALSTWQVFFILLSILLMANLSTRLMNFLDLKLRIRRYVTLLLIAVSIFAGLRLLLYETEALGLGALFSRPFEALSDVRGLIPDEFLIILVVLVVFWRGLVLATRYVDPMSVRQNFHLGLGMFVAYILLNTLVTGESPGPMLYTFFVSALIAMGAARIFTITQLRGGARNPFDLRWFAGLLGTSLAIVGLAGLIAWLVSERTAVIGGLGGLVMGIFGVVMLVVISPFIFLMERLANVMPQASGAVQSMMEVLEDLRSTFGNIAENLLKLFDIPSLANWLQLLKPFLLWGFVIAVVVVILFSITRWLVKEQRTASDEHEALIEAGDILSLLRRAIQDRLENLGASLRGRVNLRPDQRWLAAAKIRRIYAGMMDLADQLGEPRPPASTPLEFQPVLEDLLPDGMDQVQIITAAYLRVRYGEIPETEQEISQVETAWEHLRQVGRGVKSQKAREQSSFPSKST